MSDKGRCERCANRRARAAAERAARARPVWRVAALLALALVLADCGKPGAPQPPPDKPNVYPRPYPRE